MTYLLQSLNMKNLENQSILKKPLTLKARIANEVKTELPKLHSKYFKKFKGRHNLVNKFIYVPDVINGGDGDSLKDFIKSTWDFGQAVSTKTIQYDLIGFTFEKSMHLKFQYIFQHNESGLSSIAWLCETNDGWVVQKVESFV